MGFYFLTVMVKWQRFLMRVGMPIFYGSVVDMFHPSDFLELARLDAFLGGEPYTFFQYVFNFADTYVSIGVL